MYHEEDMWGITRKIRRSLLACKCSWTRRRGSGVQNARPTRSNTSLLVIASLSERSTCTPNTRCAYRTQHTTTESSSKYLFVISAEKPVEAKHNSKSKLTSPYLTKQINLVIKNYFKIKNTPFAKTMKSSKQLNSKRCFVLESNVILLFAKNC